jgi:antibiotic biosynthesis monooxygenase (ABM) superfamily enzyme
MAGLNRKASDLYIEMEKWFLQTACLLSILDVWAVCTWWFMPQALTPHDFWIVKRKKNKFSSLQLP